YRLKIAPSFFFGLGAFGQRIGVDVVHGDAVLEECGEQKRMDRLVFVARAVALLWEQAQKSVAEVFLQPQDVGVGVVVGVVRASPAGGGGDVVPVVGCGVEFGVIHPVVL